MPARVAGVEEVVLCSPPGPGGEIPAPVLAACSVASITEVYRMGGAQAIAALAYGCWVLGDTVAGVKQSVPLNPITAFLALGRGELVWPTAATILAAVLVVVLVTVMAVEMALGFAVAVALFRARRVDLTDDAAELAG